MSAVDMAPASASDSPSTSSISKYYATPSTEPDTNTNTNGAPAPVAVIAETASTLASARLAATAGPDTTAKVDKVTSAEDLSSTQKKAVPSSPAAPKAESHITATGATMPEAKPSVAQLNPATAIVAQEDKNTGHETTTLLTGAGPSPSPDIAKGTDASAIKDLNSAAHPDKDVNIVHGSKSNDANDGGKNEDDEDAQDEFEDALESRTENAFNAAAVQRPDDQSEIDSNFQERSEMDNGEEHQSNLGDDDEDMTNSNELISDPTGLEALLRSLTTMPAEQALVTAEETTAAKAEPNLAVEQPRKNSISGATLGTTDATVAKLDVNTFPSAQNAIALDKAAHTQTTKSFQHRPATEQTLEAPSRQPEDETPEEPVASYTSPHHEWAQILKKRLGKGLSDAQMLARSNSMLASPSILAQSLVQVIPSLQAKDAPLSPSSASRSYQTPEELFDRPASIEPSGPVYNFDDMPTKDDAFPSSFSTSTQKKSFLLFAPLDPDHLLGKSSSSSQPSAPTAPKDTVPSVSNQPPPPPALAPVVQPQPQPLKQRQNEQQPPHISPVPVTQSSQSSQHVAADVIEAAFKPIPVSSSSPTTIVPAKAAPSSPDLKSGVLSPSGIEILLSPALSKDHDILLITTGAPTSAPTSAPTIRTVRQNSIVSPTSQEDPSGTTSRITTNSRTILPQGSSSSLHMTPTLSGQKEPGSITPNYPIAPIQYTPVTQYKSNPAREGSKITKKPPRDLISTPKVLPATVEAPSEPPRIAEEVKEPVAPPQELPVESKRTQLKLPVGDEPVKGFWSPECAVKRQRRQGTPVRYVQYTSNIMSPEVKDERENVVMGRFHSITDVLMWRTIIQPDEVAFVELDSRGKELRSIPFKKFNQRVTGYAMYLDKKCGLRPGDNVVLWFPQDLEFVVALHACWVLGLIPIPLQLPEHVPVSQHLGQLSGHHNPAHGATPTSSVLAFPSGQHPYSHGSAPALSAKALEEKRNAILMTLLQIMDEVEVKAILGNQSTEDYVKQKSTGMHLRGCRSAFIPTYTQTSEVFGSHDLALPPLVNVTKAAKTKNTVGALSGYGPRMEWITPNFTAVYLIDPDARVGSIGARKLHKLNHETLNNLCRNQKLQFRTLPGQAMVTCMSVFSGLGFIHGCLSGVYNGGPTIIVQPSDFSANPLIWLEALTRYKVQDAALTYPLLDQLLTRLDGVPGIPPGAISLECLRNLMITGHGRIQRDKNTMAIARLGQFRFEADALDMVYSHPLNLLATSQAERAAGPVRVHVSSKNLRYGIINPTCEADDLTGMWLEDTGISTVCTSIAIVHPETMEVCAANQIGEIWVCSDSSVSSFHSPPGMMAQSGQHHPFGACIAGYDSRVRYVRTGDLGFLWNGQQQQHLQALMNQGQGTTAVTQTSHSGSGSFQLFVLGSIGDSFEVQGLLHFYVDVENTVESSHSNVAPQGCVTFKTPSGQVVCVVKVLNHDPELLVSMCNPLVHAIVEQHQFLPDTIALVDDSVATARRITDGLKPREVIRKQYATERLPLLHLHHCNSKAPALPTVSAPPMVSAPQPPVLPPLHDKAGFEPLSVSTTAAVARGGHSSYGPGQQPQPPVSAQQIPTPIASRFLTGIGPAPVTPSHSSPPHPPGATMQQHGHQQPPTQHPYHSHHASNSSSPAEQPYVSTNRNSLFGSPLLITNIPLPPGALNPLLQSPLLNNSAINGMIGYQPQSSYQPTGYGGSIPMNQQPQPLQQQQQQQQSYHIPKQHSGAGSIGSNHQQQQQQHPSAAGLPRPISQQAFYASPPLSGNSTNGTGPGSSLQSMHGSGADHRSATPGLMNEMAMFSPAPTTPRGVGGGGGGSVHPSERSRGSSHRSSQQPQPHPAQHPSQQQQQQQPYGAQVGGGGPRPVHPRQIQNQGQEARSLSAEELRTDGKASSVKSFVRGMNAKLTEIRKAGLP